jgi:hypothetical protein
MKDSVSTQWYYADYVNEMRPVPVEGLGYPHNDSLGNKMFNNSHFRTAEEAWERIFQHLHAVLRQDVAAVERHKDQLVELRERVVRGARDIVKATELKKAWNEAVEGE